jgi:hypothetical protein
MINEGHCFRQIQSDKDQNVRGSISEGFFKRFFNTILNCGFFANALSIFSKDVICRFYVWYLFVESLDLNLINFSQL